ncbi:alpha/beta fold hydrolase [Actinocorallia populi]|uniref:alpha/beta fold hydrolase n=1 Tax=Actinocorallia populi TaxID=2079200 RepID=UPI000D090076|nr:alpha/beta hydrolase [Actinocorallia populi]
MILPLPEGFERHLLRLRRGTVEAIRHPAAAGRDRGETVVMVPGHFGSKEDFRLVMPLLAAAGYDCWAYDYTDQFSATGLDSYNDYTLELLAADLVELVGERPVHYLGHCMGGLVARRAVLDRPALARSLSLVCCGPHMHGLRHRAMWVKLDGMLATTGLMGMWPTVQRLLPEGDELAAGFWRNKLETMNHAYVQGTADSMRLTPDLTGELAASGVPVLVLYGSRDRRLWSHEAYHEMAVRLGATEVVLPGAAHSPVVERPEATVMTLLSLLETAREVCR